LNVQVSSNQLSVQNMEDTIDKALQTLKAEVQGEIDGGMDGLKKSVNIVETEIAMVRKGQLENEAMIKDIRNNFDKDIGDQFEKL
jgi:hypothetical protein